MALINYPAHRYRDRDPVFPFLLSSPHTHNTPHSHLNTHPPHLQAIKRLQDVAVGVVAPYAELLAKPLVGSVAVVDLADVAKSGLPPLPAGKVSPFLSFPPSLPLSLPPCLKCNIAVT